MKKALAALGLLTAVGPAMAAVTFNPTNGTGFVGKGDVQLAFGWNNSQLQANASKISFVSNSRATYAAVCVWTTGEGTRGEQSHTVTVTREAGMTSAVAYDARQRNQITGFNLLGFTGEVNVVGKVPVVGEVCPGQGTDGAWASVTQTGSTIGELVVKYNGYGVVLPY